MLNGCERRSGTTLTVRPYSLGDVRGGLPNAARACGEEFGVRKDQQSPDFGPHGIKVLGIKFLEIVESVMYALHVLKGPADCRLFRKTHMFNSLGKDLHPIWRSVNF